MGTAVFEPVTTRGESLQMKTRAPKTGRTETEPTAGKAYVTVYRDASGSAQKVAAEVHQPDSL